MKTKLSFEIEEISEERTLEIILKAQDLHRFVFTELLEDLRRMNRGKEDIGRNLQIPIYVRGEKKERDTSLPEGIEEGEPTLVDLDKLLECIYTRIKEIGYSDENWF